MAADREFMAIIVGDPTLRKMFRTTEVRETVNGTGQTVYEVWWLGRQYPAGGGWHTRREDAELCADELEDADEEDCASWLWDGVRRWGEDRS